MTRSGSPLPEGRQPLLSEFPVPDLAAWRGEVERLLQGAPFAKKMVTRTLEGLAVNPLYTAADVPDDGLDACPGQAPYLRGTRAGGYHDAPWLVAQELALPQFDAFNEALVHDLARGQTAVHLVLDRAAGAGLDPDQAPPASVGGGGLSLANLAELEQALAGVDLETIPLLVQARSAALPLAALVVALLRRQDKDPRKLRGCLGGDPLAGLARDGSLPLSLDGSYDELAVLTRWASVQAPLLRTLPVNESPWHDAGADCVTSLGLTLAAAVQTLRKLEERGLPLETAAARIQFQVSIGSDFFMEIAKLRALRLLWSDVLSAAGCAPQAGRASVHARTSTRTQTLLDPHVNLLRATTQAMSAVLGGVDSLHVARFDEAAGPGDAFSRRLARNVQLILAGECHFDQVVDPAGGSWYVERLTRDLAAGAWTVLQETEAAGGLAAALQSGAVQDRVAAAAARRAERLADRRDVLIGTNQYPDPVERRAPQAGDHGAFVAARAAAVTASRAEACHEEHLLVLGRLEKILDADPDVLFERLVGASLQGATIGEVAGVLRHAADADPGVRPLPVVRDAEPFERLRFAVQALRDRRPERTRVHCLCLGDVARYMPRLEFTRRFFRTGGFEVVGEGFHPDAAAAVAAARQDAAPVVVLVGLDATYAEHAAALAADLKGGPDAPTVLLAGNPVDQADALTKAGVDGFIHLRSDVLDVLGRLAANLGVAS